MRVVRVSGLKEYRDRHGKLRRYHRASGTAIDPSLTGQELAARVADLDKKHAPAQAKAGTLGGLLDSYRGSPRFKNRKARTKDDYWKIMEYLAPMGDMPLVTVTSGFIAKLRDQTLAKKRAGFTNHMLAMLSSVFKHGLEYELVTANPCVGIATAEMTDDRRRPNRAWTADEAMNVPEAAPDHLRLPLLLARNLAIRRGDIVAMPRNAYSDGWLDFRASKNGKHMRLPVLGRLRTEMEAAIEAAPMGDSTLLCLNTRGKPWTANGLSHVLGEFFEECRKRKIMGEGGSIHGLRHSAGAILRGAGYTAEQRKMILGHDTDDMAEHYSASADVRGQLIDMAKRLDKPGAKRRVSRGRLDKSE